MPADFRPSTVKTESSVGPLWRQARIRSIVYQALVAVLLSLALCYFVWNAVDNLRASGIASGFDFLTREAGFAIGETTLLSYNAGNTYLKALTIGLLNTFRVATLAILLSTIVGLLIGLARLSPNWLVAKLASAYVEILRNVPLIVQLFFCYALITEGLPGPANALNPAPGVFLSNRGFYFPVPSTFFPIELDYPVLSGFNFSGGGQLSPEFAALLLGLTLYTAAFIGEIVRAGIVSVDREQVEAGQSLGLSQGQLMRFVVLPQALRVIVPPVTSQYLNCTKNSSLAVAIGYPDLVSIANTTINQTGQAIEGIALIMSVYLSISLVISAVMNGYNRWVALRGAAP